MSHLSHPQTAPIPHERGRGREVAALYSDFGVPFRDLVCGVAGCSPYLRGLLTSEKDWLSSVAEVDCAEVIPSLLRDLKGADDPDRLAGNLRRAKRRVALFVALADTGALWSLGEVTHALTTFADHAVDVTLKSLLAQEIARDRLPGCTADDLDDACGLVVLAMGKMGAFELNYSSDIDLIVLFDETRHTQANFETIRTRFIRATRRMSRILSDVTAEGYVFRTDLRLRPDPSVTPVCLPFGAAERYYESLGRTWERAAYIKARACAGDIAAGEAFLKNLTPFVWRKHLDFAAIEDAHNMRLRIREHKGLGGPIQLEGHDMKLGRGGIREIEFFTQTRQIISGGRDPDLRERGTIDGLRALTNKGWVSGEVSESLSKAYVEHRTIEHRLQMLGDAQTHKLPGNEAGFARLAAFCGACDVAGFRAGITARLERVHTLTESFFASTGSPASRDVEISRQMRETVENWRRYAAFRNARAREIFRRLQPDILARVQATVDPEETLRQFDRFLSGLPAGVQLFSLFCSNPHLIDLLVDICGSAPGLARYLSHNAQVFDAVLSGAFFEPLAGADTLGDMLSRHLVQFDDYETKLDAARRWMKENHFRIGVQHLKSMIDSSQAARHYSDLAQAVLQALLPVVRAEFSRRHGSIRDSSFAVVGMGSLGAQSLSATSDLDLIVIYDARGDAPSDGVKPLATSVYFARLTQALLTALSSPMSDGRLYEIDMRLRPSGRKGPVAISLERFTHYQRHDAWTWEHLALSRARAVAGDTLLCQRVERVRRDVMAMPREAAKTLTEVTDMRARLGAAADPRRVDDMWETRLGRGRMLDIELLAQSMALLTGSPARDVLAQLSLGVEAGWFDTDEREGLLHAYKHLSSLRQIGRLMVKGRFSPEVLGEGGKERLLAETGASDMIGLENLLQKDRLRVQNVVERCFCPPKD